jgi:hypothetical protein
VPAVISGGNGYTIYFTTGDVLHTGDFTYSFPQVLGPGETGYLVDGGTFDPGTKLKDVGRLDPAVYYTDVGSVPGALDVSKVNVSRVPYGDGLQVSGVVTNPGSRVASEATVGVIVFDAGGNIIGGLYENTHGQLDQGQSKGFKTSYPGTPPLSPSKVGSFKAFAYDFGF